MTYCHDGKTETNKNVFNELTKNLRKASEDIFNNPNFKLRKKSIDTNVSKYQNDLSEITYFLSSIHIPTFNMHFKTMEESNMFKNNIFYYYENARNIFNYLGFYLYDTDLKNQIKEFLQELGKSLRYGDYFNPSGDFLRLCTYNPKIEKAIKKHSLNANINLRNLLIYIKERFPDIDYDKTSKIAFENYKNFHKGN